MRGGKDLTWTCHNGVWWLKAPSKMTRKSTYPEIIRFFASKSNFELYVDDEHRGHGGTTPDRVLESLDKPCQRVQILGGCTVYLQAADRPQCNKELKRLVRKIMRKYRVRAVLQKHCILHKSLTKAAREHTEVN